jgi:hypothetical protein
MLSAHEQSGTFLVFYTHRARRGASFRGFGEPLITDAGEPEDLSLDGLFLLAARHAMRPIRQSDYNSHSRLHALPETDELVSDFTLPALARAGASCRPENIRPQGIRAFLTAPDKKYRDAEFDDRVCRSCRSWLN